MLLVHLVMAVELQLCIATHTRQSCNRSCVLRPWTYSVFRSLTRTVRNTTYGLSTTPYVQQVIRINIGILCRLEHLFTEAAIYVVTIIIAGDFNIHFDNETKSEPLRNLLESFNLSQHILSPTHHSGHILDLVVSSSDNNLKSSVTVIPNSVSDHHRIEIAVSILSRPFAVGMTAKRNFRNTDNVAI